jgi:hypothetical protein
MYSNDMTWQDWTVQANQKATALKSAIDQAKVLYDKWYTLTYGLTPTQIAALPQMSGHTVADITAMSYALGTFNEFNSALHNLAVPTADRESYLTPIL